jgi:hypothetical protein
MKEIYGIKPITLAKALNQTEVNAFRILKRLQAGTFASHAHGIFAAIYELTGKTPNDIIPYKNTSAAVNLPNPDAGQG